MALSNYYKENATWYTGGDANGYDIALSKSIEDIISDTGSLDLSALLNNGSTFNQLNSGYFGPNPVVYPATNDTSMISDNPATVYYLGSAVCVTGLSTVISGSLPQGVLVNLNERQGCNVDPYGYYGWDKVKDLRFVLNVKPHDNLVSKGSPVDWDSVTNWSGLGRIILKPWYYYVDPTSNFIVENEGGNSRANNFDDIPTDRHNSMTYVQYNTWLTNYSEDKADSFTLVNSALGTLFFFFQINGEIYITQNPEQTYPTKINDYMPTYQPSVVPPGYPVAYIGIGEFNKSEDTSMALPTNDDEKGFRFANVAYQGRFEHASAYLNTVNAMYYFVNSTGLKWSDHKPGIGPTAADYRRTIRLGVMDSDGIIHHNDWIIGEEQILKSDNPNKDGDYSGLPERPTPGPHPGGDDYEDDKSDSVKYGLDVNNYLGAFLNFYCCTSSDLASLKGWMRGYTPPEGEELPVGFDPINQIVGLMAFPMSIALNGTTAGSSEIKFRTGQGKSVSTGISCPVSTGGVYRIDFGSITITKRMEERGVPFLDYGTTIEIYLPFAGTYELDCQTVMGRTVSVEGFLCVATGQINYIVVAKKGGANVPVCYASGNLSAQMPISSSGWGTYLANNDIITTQGIKSITGSLASAFKNYFTISTANSVQEITTGGNSFTIGTNPVFAKATEGISIATGAIDTITSVNESDIAYTHNKNASYTTVSGSLSGTSSWFMPLHPYVRIIRPRYKLPSNYPHTVAIPQVQTKTIGSCSGLTICNNTDVSSIECTEQERSLISQYLANGIYV